MYLIYDLECSYSNQDNTPKDYNELLEIGAVIVDKDYQIIDRFQSYVALKFYPPLSEECNELLGDIRKEIEAAEELPVIWQRFEQWHRQYPIIKTAAWGISDETFLKKQLARYELTTDFFDIEFVDLKKAFRKSRPVKIKPVGLARACKIIGLEMAGKQHAADDDAFNAMLVAKNGDLLGDTDTKQR